MQNLRDILNFYVFSNIHVALGVFCFVKVTLISFEVEESNTAFFAFFGTVLSYNFIRFLNVPNQKNWMAEWFVVNRRLMFFLSTCSAIICLYLLKFFSINALLILAPFFVLTFFYGISISKNMLSLRRIPGIKIFLISTCFAGVTVAFPLVQNNVELSEGVWWLFLQRVLFVILITIPFDIRDVGFDSEKMQTIPQKFGIKKAKLFGVIAGVGVLIIERFFLTSNILVSMALLVVVIIAAILLLFSKREQSIYYSSLWVEGVPIYWLFMLIGISYIQSL